MPESISLNEEPRSEEPTARMEAVADEALSKFEAISNASKNWLNDERLLDSDSLASVNTMTSTASTEEIKRINQTNKESHDKISKEPAIARVVVKYESGARQTYYFCRSEQGVASLGLISYRAPIGRLAALSVGEEYQLPDGHEVIVVERTILRPTKMADGWDSRDTVLVLEDFGPITIKSLRELWAGIVGEDATEDILEKWLAGDTKKRNIINGIRRSVITKMGLRDQPVLDQYQDEIFRLPLNNRLLILGPPGTGKTTTLIRRLGQKLDTSYLEEEEKRVIDTIGETQVIVHEDSWLMFTPTELLKQYLKEAFAREGVPAPDSRIRTWLDYRRELARSAFGVLRTTTDGGTFVLKDSIQNLTVDALARPIDWYNAFDTWQRKTYIQELRDASAILSQAKKSEVQNLGQSLATMLSQTDERTLISTFSMLSTELSKVQKLVSKLKEESDTKIKSVLHLQLNRNEDFLNELARLIDGLKQTQTVDTDEQDEFDAEDEEDASAPKIGREAVLNAYMQAVRAQARAIASKRSLSKTTRNGKIAEWLGDRTLSDADRLEVGVSLLTQTNARRFLNPVKRYIDGIPKRYRAFRRQPTESANWYLRNGFEAKDIHPLELDVILLAILRAGRDIISRPNVLRDIDSPAWSSLRPMLGHFRNQILVDEATDFSPIQLACMGALAHPRLRSFFACGDFNQRLTTWGARSVDELKWVFPDFDIKEISVSYRQSKQLNDFARALILVVGGSEQSVSLPAHVDNVGVAPTLLERAGENEVVIWLAERIREIERFVHQLPSTAIFVNSEAEVTQIADDLNDALVEHNIHVIACKEGQAVGQETNIRVFDIQHIKGLEFEAVFFIGIDQLVTLHTELFDKYLYVGTTRAATYLGCTCKGALPSELEALRKHFVPTWETPLADKVTA